MKKKEFELSLEGRVWFSYVSMLKSGERIPRQAGHKQRQEGTIVCRKEPWSRMYEVEKEFRKIS